MVASAFHSSGICLVYPSRALLCQVWNWVQETRSSPFHLVASMTPGASEQLFRGSVAAIIDGSQHRALAADALEVGIAELGPERIAVYSDRTNEELEVHARICCAPFVLGPLEIAEWSGLFASLLRETVANRVWARTS